MVKKCKNVLPGRVENGDFVHVYIMCMYFHVYLHVYCTHLCSHVCVYLRRRPYDSWCLLSHRAPCQWELTKTVKGVVITFRSGPSLTTSQKLRSFRSVIDTPPNKDKLDDRFTPSNDVSKEFQVDEKFGCILKKQSRELERCLRDRGRLFRYLNDRKKKGGLMSQVQTLLSRLRRRSVVPLHLIRGRAYPRKGTVRHTKGVRGVRGWGPESKHRSFLTPVSSHSEECTRTPAHPDPSVSLFVSL